MKIISYLINIHKMLPKVSVIIPVFNGAKLIETTIWSVAGQTYPNLEIIVVNDGSTDQTLGVLEKLKKEISTLTIINQENQGASAAKQKGLEYSSGVYIQYLDADDILSSKKLESQVKQLIENPGKVAVCNTAHFFNGDNYLEKNIPDDTHFFDKYLNEPLKFLINLYGGFNLVGGMIQPNAFLIPKDIAIKAGRWNTKYSPCPDEDGEYFCRIILHSDGIVYTPEVMNYYRKFLKKNSLSGAKDERSLYNLFKTIELKQNHLITACEDPSLTKYIHTACYRQMDELRKRVYPQFEKLYKEITERVNELNPHLSISEYNYGGQIANFIGNKISWKILRRLQYFKNRL